MPPLLYLRAVMLLNRMLFTRFYFSCIFFSIINIIDKLKVVQELAVTTNRQSDRKNKREIIFTRIIERLEISVYLCLNYIGLFKNITHNLSNSNLEFL